MKSAIQISEVGNGIGVKVRSHFDTYPKWIRSISKLLDFWLESPCLLCERSAAHILCPTCQQRAQTCQYPQLLQPQPQSDLSILAWGEYHGDIRQMMRLLKYENQPKLGISMGQWLASAWLTQQPMRSLKSNGRLMPVMVPIPLHTTKLEQRGYNQADLIAQEFCRITRLPIVSQGLKRIRVTQPQFSLSAQERAQNLSQAFHVTDALKKYRQHPIMLIDDIYTTGATAQSAAQTLRRNGFQVAGILAFAKTSR